MNDFMAWARGDLDGNVLSALFLVFFWMTLFVLACNVALWLFYLAGV